MPLQDFETFKREHIDRPAVGDIWKNIESGELILIYLSNDDGMVLGSGSLIPYTHVIDISEKINEYKFHNRVISDDYDAQPLEKKFISNTRFGDQSL